LGFGLHKLIVRLFEEGALVNSIIGTKPLIDFAPLYFFHTLPRNVWSLSDPPLVCKAPYNIGGGNSV